MVGVGVCPFFRINVYIVNVGKFEISGPFVVVDTTCVIDATFLRHFAVTPPPPCKIQFPSLAGINDSLMLCFYIHPQTSSCQISFWRRMGWSMHGHRSDRYVWNHPPILVSLVPGEARIPRERPCRQGSRRPGSTSQLSLPGRCSARAEGNIRLRENDSRSPLWWEISLLCCRYSILNVRVNTCHWFVVQWWLTSTRKVSQICYSFHIRTSSLWWLNYELNVALNDCFKRAIKL